jgi:hypothetical protein
MSTDPASGLRGHSLRFCSERFKNKIRGKFFTNRVMNTWNYKPNSEMVNAPSVNAFKNILDSGLYGDSGLSAIESGRLSRSYGV